MLSYFFRKIILFLAANIGNNTSATSMECDLTQTQDGIKMIRALDFLLG